MGTRELGVPDFMHNCNVAWSKSFWIILTKKLKTKPIHNPNANPIPNPNSNPTSTTNVLLHH